MRLVVTGAAGFLGRILATRLANSRRTGQVLLTDRTLPETPDDPRFSAVAADLAEPGVVRDLVAEAEGMIHLAAVPGGAAEEDYEASRRVNLEASLSLLETLAGVAGRRPRLVYASSIAVFGAPLPARITDATLPRPTMTYGAHKLMVETALANLARLGRVDGVALRLPGIAARPRTPSGLQSAFISDIFHAVRAGEDFVVPMRANATVWLMSARRAADNLIHAAWMPSPTAHTPRVMTLPALRIRVGEMVTAVVDETGSASRILYRPRARLEAQFGALPPLSATTAEALGFSHDGDLKGFVRAVLADLYAGATA